MEATTKNNDVFNIVFMILVALMLSNACLAQSTDKNNQRANGASRMDSTMRQKLITTSPRLGGITISNTVTSIKADGHRFTVQMPTADISVPLYKNFKTAHPILIKTGVRYQGLILSDERKIGSNDFHSISIPILASYSLSRATNIAFIGSATISSDFKQDLEGQDILYNIGFRIGLHQNRKFKYGITPTYSKSYSGTFLLPVLDMDWTINKRLSLVAILPVRASLKYKLSEVHSLGATAWLGGNNMYRLNEPEKEQYIHLRQTNAGLIYDAKLGQRWKLNLVAGYTLMQKLETFNIDQKISLNKFNDLNHRVTNVAYHEKSFIVQSSISYQF
jgi:hypothetical protein